MAITTQSDSLQSVDADIPSNYSRLIARELGLSARELYPAHQSSVYGWADV